MSGIPEPGPLHGIRVLSFGHKIAGPLTAVMLADQGADAVHIDAPGAAAADEQADASFNRVSAGSSWAWELTRFLITILDLVAGDFTFTDITGQAFRGGYAPSRANPAGRVSHPRTGGNRP